MRFISLVKKEACYMHIIKSAGVLSVAKIVGLASSIVGGRDYPFGAVAGLAMGIMFPILYGVMGFLMGAIGAALYNLVAKWIGGLQLELHSGSLQAGPRTPPTASAGS
jgi:hypothetical protein